MASDSNATGSLADPFLLNKIDRLREKGISEYIDLPQLVVVGDQSSGKSSVLEALTELPFPRDSSLCTRFATQIVFQRAEQDVISVSIIPSPSSGADRKEKLKSFKHSLEVFSSAEFLGILGKACDVMGIPAPGNSLRPGQSTFSDDVLKIELCGPDKSHFSVIDVPGIFRTPTEGVTTKEDMSLVRGMVRRYIESSRTIILAVVPANVDIATQEILTLAAEVDSSGQRTLGVLTKPDLVDRGAEQDIIDLVKGKRNKLKLGYCIVRNRGQQDKDLSSAERHKMEAEFFKTQPWSSLPNDRVGISALNPRLRDLLSQITRQEFPRVIREIGAKLASAEQELASLGPSRETPEQQRGYLLDIAVKFQEVASHALEARYGRNTHLKENKLLRLATIIVELNSIFCEDVKKQGQLVDFDKPTSSLCVEMGFVDEPQPLEVEEELVLPSDFDYPELAELAELAETLQRSYTCPQPVSEDILVWIESAYRSSRGFELGTFNPAILTTLFQEQSKNWDLLAMKYIRDVIATAHRFCDIVLRLLCTEDRVRDTLWSLLLDELLQRYKKTVDHVKFILQTERGGTLLTTNHHFSENLENARLRRTRPVASEEARETYPITIKNAVSASTIGNIGHTVRDIHDILKSYYEVACKRFVDTIIIQATDYHLVTGPDTPLGVFSSRFVVDMKPEQLDMVAGEDATSIRRRGALKKEIESLMEGRRILIS